MVLGPAGIVVPAVNATITAAMRRACGRRPGLAAFVWQALGVAGGAAFGAYEDWRWRIEHAIAARQLDARCQAAYVAGQNEVAMGADSIIDVLTRTGPLLEDRAGVVVAQALGAWKASLGTPPPATGCTWPPPWRSGSAVTTPDPTWPPTSSCAATSATGRLSFPHTRLTASAPSSTA